MSNKYVGAGKIFFDGFTKVFKGPQHKGVVATIGGVKPKAILSEATKSLNKKLKL